MKKMGSAGFVLTIGKHNRTNAPDGWKSKIGCNGKNCLGISDMDNKLISGICSHTFCQKCLNKSLNNCAICVEEFTRILTPLCKIIKQSSTSKAVSMEKMNE